MAPFFFASAGTWVVPDGPLLFGLGDRRVGAGAAVLRHARRSRLGLGALAPRWPSASALPDCRNTRRAQRRGSLAFVLAGAETASLARPTGALSRGAVALAMIAPVLVWNAQHGWVSFAFQGARGRPGGGLKPGQVLVMALGEIAYLWPWIFVPLVARAGGRLGDGDRTSGGFSCSASPCRRSSSSP